MQKIYFSLSIVCVMLLPSIALAAGGGGATLSGELPNGENPISTPITPNYQNYQGSFGFEQQTSFYGSSSGNCGLQGYVDIGQSSNPVAETSWRVGAVLNSQKCIDQEKLELIRTESNKLQSVTQQNIACIQARTDLIKSGHNPDTACVLK
jgi:hypothetical protein